MNVFSSLIVINSTVLLYAHHQKTNFLTPQKNSLTSLFPSMAQNMVHKCNKHKPLYDNHHNDVLSLNAYLNCHQHCNVMKTVFI